MKNICLGLFLALISFSSMSASFICDYFNVIEVHGGKLSDVVTRINIPVDVNIDLNKKTITTLAMEKHYKKVTPFSVVGVDGRTTLLGGAVDKSATTFAVKDGKLIDVVVSSYEHDIDKKLLAEGKGPDPFVVIGYESCH